MTRTIARMANGFVQSGELNAAFHAEVVRPLLAGTSYAAGLLGWGSEVLGYDTERSTDHGWGPRLCVFVDDADVAAVRDRVDAGLPDRFGGWPVRFALAGRPPRHHVTVTTLSAWLRDHLGVDATEPLSTRDWLLLPQQQVLGVVRGRVYADDGRLAAVRDTLAWYPDQVWRWLLACQWRRLDQEEPFVQRTAEAGDDLGSAVIAARLVRDTIRVRAARATAQRARPDRAARPVGVAVPRPPGPGARRRPVHRRLPGDGHRPLPARTAADRRDRPVRRQHRRAQRPEGGPQARGGLPGEKAGRCGVPSRRVGGVNHPNIDKVAGALRAAGATGEIRILPNAAPTAAAAAEQLGCEVGAIANSLIFDGDGAPVLILTSGAHRVDTGKVAAELGLGKLRRATPEFVREHTGQPIGGVAPVGHPEPVRTLIDSTLSGYDEVWAAGGIPHAVFPTSYDELLRITSGTPITVN